jgi:hypothetical protein
LPGVDPVGVGRLRSDFRVTPTNAAFNVGHLESPRSLNFPSTARGGIAGAKSPPSPARSDNQAEADQHIGSFPLGACISNLCRRRRRRGHKNGVNLIMTTYWSLGIGHCEAVIASCYRSEQVDGQ